MNFTLVKGKIYSCYKKNVIETPKQFKKKKRNISQLLYYVNLT